MQLNQFTLALRVPAPADRPEETRFRSFCRWVRA